MASVKIIGKVAVKVMPDTSDFKDQLKKELEKIEKSIGDMKVDVVPQISKAAKDAVKAEFAKLRQDLEGKKVNIDLGLKNGDVATIESALDVLTRNRKVNVEVDYDGSRIAREMADSLLMLGGARPQLDALAEGFEKLRNIDYIALNTGIMATKVTLLGGAALAATGHIFSLSSDLLSISQLGFALPGILGGIVIGLGTTAAAFADFNQYVPQAKGYMEELQNVISNNFWEVAGGRINDFIDGVFPVLHKNLRETATVLGEFWGSLAESAGTNLNPALRGMFVDLNESIVIATGSVDSIVNIIKVLGETGAGYLPRLAEWFTQITDQFSNFLTNAQNTGQLQAWVEEGIINLKALGGVLLNTYNIFSDIAGAASLAGGAGLVGLAAGLKDIASVTSSEGFQSGLRDVFETAFIMMESITNTAGPGLKAMILQIADVFNTVGPGLAAGVGLALAALGEALSSPAVKDGALALFGGISDAIANITPAIGPIVGMIASLGPVFAALLSNISAIGTQGIDKLAPTFTKVAEAITPIIEKLGGLILNVMDDLTPVFQQMGENVAKLVTAFGPLIDAVQELWNKIAPFLIPVLKIVVTILGDMLMGVITGITMVFKGLVKIIDGVVQVFKGIGDVVAGLFTGDFSRVGDGFKQIFSGLGDIVMGALEGIAGAFWAWINGSFFAIFRKAGTFLLGKVTGIFGKVFGAIPEGLTAAFNWVVKGSEDGVAAVGGVFSRLLDVIKYPFQRIAEVVGPIITGAFNFIKGIFSTAFKVIEEVVTAAWTVISTVFTTYFSIIRTIVETAWTVISGVFTIAFTTIKAFLTAAWGGIVTFFQTTMDALYFVFKGPWDAVSEFLLGLWTNIKAGAMLIWDSLRTWFDEFLLKMSIRFEDAWNAIKGAVETAFNAVKNFLTGLWDGIKTMIGTKVDGVQSKLSDVWDAIRTKVTDIWETISNKISGVWDSIKTFVGEKVGAVRETLAGVWNTIKGKVDEIWNGIETKIDGVWTTIKSTVETAVGKVKSSMDDAWTKIKTAVTDAWDAVKTTVETKIGEVKTKVEGIATSAASWLGDLGGTLKAAGSALIQGFIDGLQAKFQAVKDKLGELTKLLPDWKGPAPLDRVLLTPAGEMVIEGFLRGLESQYKNVRDSLNGLTSDIAGQFDGQSYRVGIATDLDTSNANLSAIGSLSASVGSAVGAAPATSDQSVRIDNITIPLEDLKQLSTLEEFLDMLRVRTRKG